LTTITWEAQPGQCRPDLARVADDDRATVEAFFRNMAEAPYSEIEYRLRDDAGEERWVRDAIRVIPGRDGARTFHGVTVDISDKKMLEHAHERRLALLAAALEGTADGLLVLDEQTRIVASNRKLAEMWGTAPDLFAPGDSTAALTFLLEKVADPSSFQRRANRPSTRRPHDGGDEIFLADGRVFERYARPFELDGRPVGLVVTCRDMTAIHEAEVQHATLLERETSARGAAEESRFRAEILAEDLRHSLDQLQQAHDEISRRERLSALGEIAATVAHEVRNALGASFNAVARLRRLVGTDGEVGVLLQVVQDEARRLDRLVLDLLVFARPRRGTFRYQPAEGLLEDAVVAAFRAVDHANLVRVSRNFAADLPAIFVDGGLVCLALTNVLTNALQTMPEGGQLTIDAALAVDDDRTFVALAISDTGPGIPDDALARIFEPFFTTKALGTGLGLPIAKRVIEEQGGRVRVASETGRGTTFTLWLPC
jgi:PAS domain S-box-containing protein